jgi:hypothetical protein
MAATKEAYPVSLITYLRGQQEVTIKARASFF